MPSSLLLLKGGLVIAMRHRVGAGAGVAACASAFHQAGREPIVTAMNQAVYGDTRSIILIFFRFFDRNDAIVHPQLSRKLKLRGRWWHIYGLHEEFELLVESLKKGEDGQPRTMETSLHWFKKEIQPDLESITKKINRTYPGSDLEKPIAEIFRNVPGVKDVKEQGGAGERGADLRVIFEWEVPILGIQEQRTCVVQVKSFEGEMWETKAVDQIQKAPDHWDADVGVIVSTASSGSEALDTALDQL